MYIKVFGNLVKSFLFKLEISNVASYSNFKSPFISPTVPSFENCMPLKKGTSAVIIKRQVELHGKEIIEVSIHFLKICDVIANS